MPFEYDLPLKKEVCMTASLVKNVLIAAVRPNLEQKKKKSSFGSERSDRSIESLKKSFLNSLGKNQERPPPLPIKAAAKPEKKEIPGWNDGEGEGIEDEGYQYRKAKKIVSVKRAIPMQKNNEDLEVRSTPPEKTEDKSIEKQEIKPVEKQDVKPIEEVKPLEKKPEIIKKDQTLKSNKTPPTKPDLVLVHNDNIPKENLKKIEDGLKESLMIKIHSFSLNNLKKESLPKNSFLTLKLHLNSREDPGVITNQLARVNECCKESILVIFELYSNKNLQYYYEQNVPNSGYEKEGKFLKKYIIHRCSTINNLQIERNIPGLLNKIKDVYEEFVAKN